MIGLGACAQRGVLHLDEIADLAALFHHSTGPEPRKGADRTAGTYTRAFQMAESVDRRTIGDSNAGAEHNIGFNRDIAAQLRVMAEEHRLGRDQRRPLRHRRFAPYSLPARFDCREFRARVDARHFISPGFDDHDLVTTRNRAGRHIGQVVFALRIVVADIVEQRPHIVRMRNDQAGVAQPRPLLALGRILELDHLADCAVIVSDNPAIGERICGAKAQHSHLCAAFQSGNKALHCFRLDHRAIAETHHHQAAEACQRIFRLQGRVRSAQLQFLQRDHNIAASQSLAQLFVPVTRHHDRMRQ